MGGNMSRSSSFTAYFFGGPKHGQVLTYPYADNNIPTEIQANITRDHGRTRELVKVYELDGTHTIGPPDRPVILPLYRYVGPDLPGFPNPSLPDSPPDEIADLPPDDLMEPIDPTWPGDDG